MGTWSHKIAEKIYSMQWRHLSTKGQLISKYLFGLFTCSQKKNKNKWTWGIIVVKSNFLVHFLRELRIPKSPFEINWPLATILVVTCKNCSWNWKQLWSQLFDSCSNVQLNEQILLVYTMRTNLPKTLDQLIFYKYTLVFSKCPQIY